MRPEIEKKVVKLAGIFCNFVLLDVEGVSALQRNDLIIFVTAILRDQVDLILEREQEQHGLLPRDRLHVHVVDLEDLVAGLQPLGGGRRPRLNGRHEDTDLVATSESNANAARLLETDEPRIGTVTK